MCGGITGHWQTTYLLSATSLGGFILWLLAKLAQRASRNLSLPPGPRGLPLIGDLRHVADLKWLASPQRRDEYGEMMYVSSLGKGFLIMNSHRVAVDLLEKRSNIYSGRPRYISAGDYLTGNLTLVLSPYCDRMRRFRRAAAEGFSKSAVQRFHPIKIEKYFQRHGASIMLSVNYHFLPVESDDDPRVVGIASRLRRMMHEMQPGTRLVEYFPWLSYVPSRFAKWKRDAQYWFIQDSLLYQRLLRKVEDDLANGIDRPSFGATVIKNRSKYHLSEREQAWLVGGTLSAGVETTSTSLQWWLLAMLAYPKVQVRAHAELDEVVGRARPPTFADVPSFPYIRAMVKETLRWAPIHPLGGTVCFQNTRVLNFDPEVFGSNAAEFNPARYLDEKEGTLVIDFATLLWAMRFERPESSQGELDVRNFVQSGVTARPVPFECKAVPRFMEAEALLKEALSLYG
ncbi:cytochrome P450 [Lactarius psammicola]|nr:cytochrome P450 [Lactarius psammicola]